MCIPIIALSPHPPQNELWLWTVSTATLVFFLHWCVRLVNHHPIHRNINVVAYYYKIDRGVHYWKVRWKGFQQ